MTLFDLLPLEVLEIIIRHAQYEGKRRSARGALNLLRLTGPLAAAARIEFTVWCEEPDNDKERRKRAAMRRERNFSEPEGLQLSTRLIADYSILSEVAEVIGSEVCHLKIKNVKVTFIYVDFVKQHLPNIRRLSLQGNVSTDYYKLLSLFEACGDLELLELRDVPAVDVWIPALTGHVKNVRKLRLVSTKPKSLFNHSYPCVSAVWDRVRKRDCRLEQVEIVGLPETVGALHLDRLAGTGVEYSMIAKI